VPNAAAAYEATRPGPGALILHDAHSRPPDQVVTPKSSVPRSEPLAKIANSATIFLSLASLNLVCIRGISDVILRHDGCVFAAIATSPGGGEEAGVGAHA
jgi:hypothetical protein